MEEVVHSQGSQKARTWQRPLEWKIPISLPVSEERLEWNSVHRGASEGLGSEEEEEGAANFLKKFYSEGKTRERFRQIEEKREHSKGENFKMFYAGKKAAVEREIEEDASEGD